MIVGGSDWRSQDQTRTIWSSLLLQSKNESHNGFLPQKVYKIYTDRGIVEKILYIVYKNTRQRMAGQRSSYASKENIVQNMDEVVDDGERGEDIFT